MPAEIDNSMRFAERLLLMHNRERTRIGQPPLVWSARLAQHAQGWADSLARRGAFEHSEPDDLRGEGENLWMGTAGAYSLEEMIGHFIDEREDFKPGRFPQVSRAGDWTMVGHYTQMIWPTTREVGCAMATHGDNDYLACRYTPMGNVDGQHVP